MHPHAKQEQDDADLRQLGGEMDIGDKPGGKRSNGDPRQQVADQRRKTQA